MARYALTTDVPEVLTAYLRLQLFDDDADGVEDVGLVESVLGAACDEVDLHLSAAYGAPLTGSDITGGVKNQTLRVFRYLAHARKSAVSDAIWQDYQATVTMLGLIAERKRGLGGDERPTERAGLAATVTSETKLFGRTNLAGL